MKNNLSVYLIVLVALFAITSCAVNDQEDMAEIEDQIAPPPEILLPNCDGFDLFVYEAYDCGYSVGIKDYIAFYNDAVEQLGIDECSKIRVDFSGSGSSTVAKVKSAYVSNHYQIMQLVTILTQAYRTNVDQYQNSSIMARNRGQHDGFYAIYGQQPLASANDDCSLKNEEKD